MAACSGSRAEHRPARRKALVNQPRHTGQKNCADQDDDREYTRAAEDRGLEEEPRRVVWTRAEKLFVLPSETDLQLAFAELNNYYFNGEVPVCRIRYNARFSNSAGRITYSERPLLIELSPKHFHKHPEALRETLLHEMIHAWLFDRAGDTGHGAAFRKKMRECGMTSIYHDLGNAKPFNESARRYILRCEKCALELLRKRLPAGADELRALQQARLRPPVSAHHFRGTGDERSRNHRGESGVSRPVRQAGRPIFTGLSDLYPGRECRAAGEDNGAMTTTNVPTNGAKTPHRVRLDGADSGSRRQILRRAVRRAR